MSIQEHLNKIRNAVYGREVRESIAKGIETAYDDASENDNANMEVKIARGTNPNLNTRLNKMDETDKQTTAQLAQKATKAEVSEKATKGEIGLDDLDKNKIKYDATWFDDTFIQELANGNINTTFVQPKSITSEKVADKAIDFTHLDSNVSRNLSALSIGLTGGVSLAPQLTNGRIDDSSGELLTGGSQNRLRTNEFIHLNQGDEIELTEENYHMYIYLYDLSTSSYINSVGWTNIYKAESAVLARVVVRHQSEVSLSPASFPALTLLLNRYGQDKYLLGEMKDEINDKKISPLRENLNVLSADVTGAISYSDQLSNGRIDGVTGELIASSPSQRLRTNDFITMSQNDRIVLNNTDFQMYVHVYNVSTDAFINAVGWTNEYEADQDRLVRIMIRHKNDIAVTPDLIGNTDLVVYHIKPNGFNQSMLKEVKGLTEKLLGGVNYTGFLVNGRIGVNGELLTTSGRKRMRTNEHLNINKGDKLSLTDKKYQMYIYIYDNVTNDLLESIGWVNKFEADSDLRLRVVVRHVDELDISPLTVPSVLLILQGFNNNNVETKLRTERIEQNLLTAPIITDWVNEKMAHCFMLYEDKYSGDGTMWGIYYTNEDETFESPSVHSTYVALIKFNIADPTKVEKWKVIEVDTPVGGFTQEGRAPYDPNIVVLEDKLVISFNAYIDKKIAIGTLEFDKQTEQIGNFQVAKLTYMTDQQSKTVDLDASGIRIAYNELGFELGADLKDMCLSNSFIEHEGYLFGGLAGAFDDQGFRGMVIKTQDGVNWDFVTIPTTYSESVTEIALEIVDDKLFYATRDSRGVSIGVYNLITKTWGDFKIMRFSRAVKPALVYVNDKLYIGYNGNDEVITDWGYVPRSNYIIKEVDVDNVDNMREVASLRHPFGVHYVCFVNYKGDLYMTFSQDRRKLDITQVRSDIAFAPLKF